MSSNNLILQLQGAFLWIERTRELKALSSYEQIQELFIFLNIDASKEEIEALHELANPFGEKNIKFENLQKVFQYDKQAELKEMVQAYSYLANGEPTLSLEKLENYLKVYDKKYKNSVFYSNNARVWLSSSCLRRVPTVRRVNQIMLHFLSNSNPDFIQIKMKMSSTARPDTNKSKAKLTRYVFPSPFSEQFQALSKMYQGPTLNKLLKQTDKGKPSLQQTVNFTPRTNTPKSCRTPQEFQMKYFFFQKGANPNNNIVNKQEAPLKQNYSQLVTKSHQLSQHRNYSNLNLTQGKDTPKNKPQTERKYNLLSADFEKQIKSKAQDPKYQSHLFVQQLAQQLKKKSPKETEIKREKKENLHLSLDDFVTQVARTNPTQFVSPFKQAKSLSPSSRVHSTLKKFVYYVTHIVEAFQKNDQNGQLYRDHALQTYNCIGFCMNLPSPDITEIEKKKLYIPFKSNLKFRKTVVFDLDETLIHCNENQSLKADIYLPITFPSGDTVQAGINIRPFAKWILNTLSEVCEVIVFTASHACYAQKVIQYLDQGNILSASLFRDKCMVSEDGVHIKDLRVINREAKDIVLVDNAAYSFGIHIENGIPIVPYYDNKDDRELKQLYDYLINHVLPANDCRTVLQETFKLREFSNFVGPKSAIEKLYF